MQPSSRSPRCLEAYQLVFAAAENHRSWFRACASASQGHAHHHGSVLCTHPGDRGGDGHIAFPDLAASFPDEVLDALISDYRPTKPAVNVLCWATAPDSELGVRLVARGFEKSWRPHWMAADLTLVNTNVVAPESVTFELAEHLPESAWPQPPRAPRPESSLSQPDERQSWHFAAVLAGRVVGQSKLHLTSGVRGVAGIYDVEVDRAFQRRGIGRALTAMALEEARRRGYRNAVLNSTPAGEQLYRRLGFQSLGHGQTWFLRAEVHLAPPAEITQVRLAEAIGRGHDEALAQLRGQLTSALLTRPLPCGMTPVELAVRFSQPHVARWLATQGALVDVVSAWDLGWRSEVVALLRNHRELTDFRSGFRRTTPLHTAAERDDLALATVILAARPDLTATDAVFNATALGWAEHLGHSDLAQLLRQHEAMGFA